MAGMKFETEEISEVTLDVSQNREFRRRFVGDIAELMNNFCSALEKNFGLKGSQPQHVFVDALIRAAMEHGVLKFHINGQAHKLDVSEASYGNVAGLLRETQSWETSKSVVGSASAATPPLTTADAEDAAGKQTPSLIPELTPEEQSLLPPQAVDVGITEERETPAETPSSEEADDEGDAKNQLPMPLDDEAEEPAPVVKAENESDEGKAVAEAMPVAKPERVKPVKPDFSAAMTGKKNS